jgi:hypothetical protein
MQEKNGITYEGSSGIEIYVGSNTGWAKNQWFSMFNYTPLLRFYMDVDYSSSNNDSYYRFPDWGYEWDFTNKKWTNPMGMLRKYGLSVNNGWGYGRIWSLGKADTASHYFWCYDPSYHKGMLSMEAFCGASGWDNIVAHYRHFILLPTDFYDDDHHLITLPVGYTVTIINSQFRKTNRYSSSNNGKKEEKGEYGWPR